MILLFTGESGEAFGYRDEFRPDGTFWYTGEGQRGDMAMVRGNRAIMQHRREGKTMHLFESDRSPVVKYLGEATCLGYHWEERPDVDGIPRKAIVFELDITYPRHEAYGVATVREPGSRPPRFWTMPLSDLRNLALQQPDATASESVRKAIARLRSEAVRVYVLRRANGVCEACGQPAPFKTTDGRPYLEPHHIRRVADGGPDHPRWVAALCPNCHREAHHGKDRASLNHELAERLGKLESE